MSNGSWRCQLFLICLLNFATGWMVGVAKLSQVLMTSSEGPFATKSEARAETFLVTFGISKAIGNLVVGLVADKYGRRHGMITGWFLGSIFAGCVLLARSWAVIVWSDLLLGLNQAFCWSASLFMILDILGPSHRALGVGLSETLGYSAIAAASPFTSRLGLHNLMGLHVMSLCLSLTATMLSCIALSDTKATDQQAFVQMLEDGLPIDSSTDARRTILQWPEGRREVVPTLRVVVAYTSCIDASLMVCCLVGMTLNFTTAYAWGAMSRWLTTLAHSHSGGNLKLGGVLFLYSVPKGLLQFPAGWLADRKFLCGASSRDFVVFGLFLMAIGLTSMGVLAAIGTSADTVLMLASPVAFVVGAGTACAYSPVVACVVGRADSSWRASAIGTYRAWRDAGFAVGGMILGRVVDNSGGSAMVAPVFVAVTIFGVSLLFRLVYDEQENACTKATTPQDKTDDVTKASLNGHKHLESLRFGISYDDAS